MYSTLMRDLQAVVHADEVERARTSIHTEHAGDIIKLNGVKSTISETNWLFSGKVAILSVQRFLFLFFLPFYICSADKFFNSK